MLCSGQTNDNWLHWTIKYKGLYIKKINPYRSDYATDYKPTMEEAKRKLEELTGGKFGKDGLFADFVTGKFVLYKFPPTLRERGDKNKYTLEEEHDYSASLIEKQKIYAAEFNNGELIRLVRDRQLEEEYKKRKIWVGYRIKMRQLVIKTILINIYTNSIMLFVEDCFLPVRYIWMTMNQNDYNLI